MLRQAYRRLCTDEIPGLRRSSFAKRLPRPVNAPSSPPAESSPPPSGPQARIATALIKASSVDLLAARYKETIPALYAGVAGFQGAHLFLNRDENKAQSVTLWSSQHDFDAAAARPEYKHAMQELGAMFAKVPDLEVWEHVASVFSEDS
ncbi:hypothetical protein AB1Y20_019273 [Prymnesium parvum]|uniref:ABM domain-containing protein n=1 Tax=Prymnesium parvum TaxID=97485 RepID=A0AB34JTN0_PRYPA